MSKGAYVIDALTSQGFKYLKHYLKKRINNESAYSKHYTSTYSTNEM